MCDTVGFLISVIIICTGEEKNISRCLESVIKQSLGIEKIQIILINKGINLNRQIYEYEKEYENNILIINMDKDEGINCAKNNAIQYVKSDYFIIISADDYMDESMLYDFFSHSYGCDYVSCSMDETENTLETQDKNEYEIYDLSIKYRDEFIQRIRNRKSISGVMLRTAFWINNELFFPEEFNDEESYVIGMIALYANKAMIVSKPLYHCDSQTINDIKCADEISTKLSIQKIILEKARKIEQYDKIKDIVEFSFFEQCFIKPVCFFYKKQMLDADLIKKFKEFILDNTPNIEQNVYYQQKKELDELYDCSLFYLLIRKDINELLVRRFENCFSNSEKNKTLWEYMYDSRLIIETIITAIKENGIESFAKNERFLELICDNYNTIYQKYIQNVNGLYPYLCLKEKLYACKACADNKNINQTIYSLYELKQIFERDNIQDNYAVNTGINNYIIKNTNMIAFYYDWIKICKCKHILDVGVFLKRMGMVSRMNSFSSIPKNTQLDALEVVRKYDNVPVYEVIYNNIYYCPEDLPNKYDLIFMLDIEGLTDEESVRAICEYSMNHSKMVAFGSWQENCHKYFSSRKEECKITYVDCNEDIYVIVEPLEK